MFGQGRQKEVTAETPITITAQRFSGGRKPYWPLVNRVCVCVRYLYKTCFKKTRSEIHLKMGCIWIEYAKTRRSPLLIKQLLTCRAVLQKLNEVECDVTYYWFMGWNQRPFLKQKRRQASTCLTLECDLFSVVTYFWMHKTYFDR